MNPGLYLDAILLKSSRDFVKNSRKIVKELEAKYQILTDLLDGDPHINEMKSSEEMRSKFDDYNKNEVKKRAVVTSMDANHYIRQSKNLSPEKPSSSFLTYVIWRSRILIIGMLKSTLQFSAVLSRSRRPASRHQGHQAPSTASSPRKTMRSGSLAA